MIHVGLIRSIYLMYRVELDGDTVASGTLVMGPPKFIKETIARELFVVLPPHLMNGKGRFIAFIVGITE